MTGREIQPVDKPIKAVLAEFLEDQRKRLRPTTFRRYDSVIELFEASMDRYASQYLEEMDNDFADDMVESGARASKDLPAAEALSKMLAAHADAATASVGKRIEGRFEVRAVGPTSLALEEIASGERTTVPVPAAAAKACRPGWTISGCIGKTARGWRLAEVWNVYT